MSRRTTLVSDIAYSAPDRVMVKGHDLSRDILGHLSLGDMAFLMFTDRLPEPRESVMFNALANVLVEHGVTPSAIATRMTLAGAPEAMHAAIAAGLNGLGSRFVGSMEDAARLLQEALPDPAAPHDIDAMAEQCLERLRQRSLAVPGIGHRVHKPVDPRAERLFEIAQEQGFAGPYVALIRRLAALAQERTGKTLPVNATGAVGAIASEMRIPWTIVRGLGVIGRAIGLVAHVREELEHPMAREIMIRVMEETGSSRTSTSKENP